MVRGMIKWWGEGRSRGTVIRAHESYSKLVRFVGASLGMGRTAFWAAGLFCTAVPMTHNACTFTSSEGEASKSCSGSHMPSFSRSYNKWD